MVGYNIFTKSNIGQNDTAQGLSTDSVSMGKPEAVFLDLDNTIWGGTCQIMEMIFGRLHYAIFHGVDINEPSLQNLRQEDLKEGAEFFKRTINLTSLEQIDELIHLAKQNGKKVVNKKDEYIQFYERIFEQNIENVKLLPGAAELLKVLDSERKAERVKVYAISLAMQRVVDRLFNKLGIKELFDERYAISSDGAKPSPKGEIIKNVLAQNKIEPHKAVMVGDSVGDMIAAQEAGVRGIGLVSEPEIAEKLRKVNPQAIIIPDLYKMVLVLNQLGS